MSDEDANRCDLCNESCVETQSNLLACTYKNCVGGMYHQECLEKFLKSNRLEKNRKTGFKCPRGCGKGTKFPEPCPGRIDKSHPIYPRNEEKVKKRQQAVVEQPVAKPTKVDKAAEKAAKAAAAAKAKADGTKAKAEQDAAIGDGLGGKGKDTMLQPIGKAHKDKQQALPLHEQLAQAKAAARKEMGLSPLQYPSTDSSSSKDTSATLSRAGSKTMVPVSAWGKSGSASASASLDLDVPPPPPELPTLGQLPLLQQLMQQSDKRRPRQAAAFSQPPAPPHHPPATPPFAQANGTTSAPQTQPQLDSIQHFPPVSSSNPPAAPRFVPLSPYSSSVSSAAAAAQAKTESQAHHHQQFHHHPHQPPQSDLGTETSELSELPSLPDGELLDYADTDAHTAALKLSKAQRKNLKRADKKKKKSMGNALDGPDPNTLSDTASVAESDQDAAPAVPSSSSGAAADGRLLQGASDEQCIEALVAHKALRTYQQLQRLGFTRWQAASALQCYGLQLQLGVEWLLLHLGDQPQQLAAAAAAAPLPVIDIASDLSHLQEAQSILHAPQDVVHRAVVKCRGDVHAAVMSLAQAGTPPHHRPTNSAIRHSHEPSGESFHSAQSDIQSLPSQDLEPLPTSSSSQHASHHNHLPSLGHTPALCPSLSSAWLPALASSNGRGSPAPGMIWDSGSGTLGTRPQQQPIAGTTANGGVGGSCGSGSRLSAWLRSDQQSLEQSPSGGGEDASSMAAWGGSSGQQSLEGLSSGLQEGNPWGSSPLLGQYSDSQQDSTNSLLRLII